MFSSSVRRALFAVPASPIAVTFSSSASRTAVPLCRSQRRYSSSNPSSPPNGARGVADGQPAPTRASRRKAKEVVDDCTVRARDKTMQNLPSVPSTTHLKSQDITASDFFSLHRPISVTEVWPKTITNEMFGAIFTKSSPKTQTNEVIGALSSTIEGLDHAVRKQILFEADLQSGFLQGSQNQGEPKHLDQAPPQLSIPFPPHAFHPKFMPYNPPPPPVPMNDAQATAANFETAEELSRPKTYHALVTVEESKDENGDVQYTSYASEFVAQEEPDTESVPAKEEPTSPSFLGRMRIRQKRYDDSMGRRSVDNRVWAISVKRQRKLKMKKHKYKKLMRRTRNLRRRLDRN